MTEIVIKKLFIPPQCTFLKSAEHDFRLFFHRTWGNDVLVQRTRIYEDEKNIMFCLSWRGKSCQVKNYPFLFLEMEWATSFLCLFVVCIWCHLEEDRKCIDLENGFKHVMYVFCANMCILCYIQNHLHLKVFFMAKWENKPKSYIVLAKACLKLCHFLLVKYVFVNVNSVF